MGQRADLYREALNIENKGINKNPEKNVPDDYWPDGKAVLDNKKGQTNDLSGIDKFSVNILHEEIESYLASLDGKVKVLHENQRQLQARIDEINNIKRDIENILFGGR